MAIGSGLGASLGVAAESAYGTYAAPSRWLEFTSESLQMNKNVIFGSGLRNNSFRRASRRVVTNSSGSGSVSMEVASKGMGLLFQHMLGSSATAVQQGSTTAYLQTHTPGNIVGKSLTLQKGVPQLNGTVVPYTFTGCKINKWDLKVATGAIATLDLDIDARAVTAATSLVTPSYPATNDVFHFAEGSVTVDGTTVAAVTGATITGDNKLRTDRYYLGDGGLKAEPVPNDYIDIGGSLSVDFVDRTVFADRYLEDTPCAVVLSFVGPVISGAYNETLTVTLPRVYLGGELPTVGGPGTVAHTANFTALDNGTDPVVTIAYTSPDTTV